MDEDKGLGKPLDRSPEVLKTLAKEYHNNLIFTDRQVRPDDRSQINMIFMGLIFLSGKMADDFKLQVENGDIDMLWEYNSEAGPRSINGYPCFTSLRTMSKREAKVFWYYVRKIETLMNQI
tara:strand:- start:640 stop:1002 length:363 start_codon:yes stop_codon:yes gene_type:complete